MNPTKIKNLNVFTASVIIFILIAGYSGYIYWACNKPLEVVAGKDIVNIEVSLPVLEWTKYMDLSKKIDISANIKKIKRNVVENELDPGELKPFK